jgi:hypothetical protein
MEDEPRGRTSGARRAEEDEVLGRRGFAGGAVLELDFGRPCAQFGRPTPPPTATAVRFTAADLHQPNPALPPPPLQQLSLYSAGGDAKALRSTPLPRPRSWCAGGDAKALRSTPLPRKLHARRWRGGRTRWRGGGRREAVAGRREARGGGRARGGEDAWSTDA